MSLKMKYKLSGILNALSISQCNELMFRKLPLKKISPLKLWKITKNKIINYNPYEKDILNYITSRNMSKTLRYSTPNDVLIESLKKSDVKVKNLVGLMAHKYHELNLVSMFKFHTKTNLLGSLASKQPEGKQETKEELEDQWGGPEAFKLIVFAKDNLNEIIEKNESVIVYYSAAWCPHCKRLKKPFGAAALMAKAAKLPHLFATFDVNTNPDIADEKGVIGIPTIKYYKNGKYVATFRGKRTADDLFQFFKNPYEHAKASKRPEI